MNMGGQKSKPASEKGDSTPATGGARSDAPSAGASAAATSSSSSSGTGSGAYLIYTPESGGMLYLQWSDFSVPDALAFFRPRKAVPEHKKKLNAGRLELIRGIASHKVKMFEGAVHFVKEAALLDADIVLLQDKHFEMWYCQGTAVKGFKVGDFVSVSKVGALAVMPHNNTSFKGVQKTDVHHFVNLATREGAAWSH